MEINEMAKEALNTESDLKLIMKGEVVEKDSTKIGVTSTIFISKDKHRVKELFIKYQVNLVSKKEKKPLAEN